MKNDYNNAGGDLFLNYNNKTDTAYTLTFQGATGSAFVYNLSESDQLVWKGVTKPIDWLSRFLTNADFDGDGNKDILVGASDGNVYSYLFDDNWAPFGNEWYSLPSHYTHSISGLSISIVNGSYPVYTAININNDPNSDLAVITDNTVYFHLSNGDGTFSSNGILTLDFNWASIKSFDFDHDALPDLLITGSGSSDLKFLLGDGLGNYEETFSKSTSSLLLTDAGDLDNDGNLDVVINSEIFLGRGDGSFSTTGTTISITPGMSITATKVVDINSDGNQDVVLGLDSGGIVIGYGNGVGGYDAVETLEANVNQISFIEAADFNNDNRIDLFYSGYYQNTGFVLNINVSPYLGEFFSI